MEGVAFETRLFDQPPKIPKPIVKKNFEITAVNDWNASHIKEWFDSLPQMLHKYKVCNFNKIIHNIEYLLMI